MNRQTHKRLVLLSELKVTQKKFDIVTHINQSKQWNVSNKIIPSFDEIQKKQEVEKQKHEKYEIYGTNYLQLQKKHLILFESKFTNISELEELIFQIEINACEMIWELKQSMELELLYDISHEIKNLIQTLIPGNIFGKAYIFIKIDFDTQREFNFDYIDTSDKYKKILLKHIEELNNKKINFCEDMRIYEKKSLQYKTEKKKLYKQFLKQLNDSSENVESEKQKEQNTYLIQCLLLNEIKNPLMKFIFSEYGISGYKHLHNECWNIVGEYLSLQHNNTNNTDYEMILKQVNEKYKCLCFNECCFTYKGLCYNLYKDIGEKV